MVDSPKFILACQWIIKYFCHYSSIWEWSNQLTLRTRNRILNELQGWMVQVGFYTQITQGKKILILSFQNTLSNILWRTMNIDKKFTSAQILVKTFSLKFSKKRFSHIFTKLQKGWERLDLTIFFGLSTFDQCC